MGHTGGQDSIYTHVTKHSYGHQGVHIQSRNAASLSHNLRIVTKHTIIQHLVLFHFYLKFTLSGSYVHTDYDHFFFLAELLINSDNSISESHYPGWHNLFMVPGRIKLLTLKCSRKFRGHTRIHNVFFKIAY